MRVSKGASCAVCSARTLHSRGGARWALLWLAVACVQQCCLKAICSRMRIEIGPACITHSQHDDGIGHPHNVRYAVAGGIVEASRGFGPRGSLAAHAGHRCGTFGWLSRCEALGNKGSAESSRERRARAAESRSVSLPAVRCSDSATTAGVAVPKGLRPERAPLCPVWATTGTRHPRRAARQSERTAPGSQLPSTARPRPYRAEATARGSSGS